MKPTLVERRRLPRLERRIQLRGVSFHVAESFSPGQVLLSLGDFSAHATPEQCLDVAQALAEFAVLVAQRRPAQMLVVPGRGLSPVQA